MVERETVITTVKQIIIDILGWDKTPADFPGLDLPRETQMDSAQALEVIVEIEQEYDIIVSDNEVNEELFTSAATLADMVLRKLA